MGRSKTYRFRQFEFYAERGMITLVDTEAAADRDMSADDAIKRITPGDFMKRAISALITEPDKYPSKLAELRRLVSDAKEACLLAKKQGDPSDPSVLEHVVKHQRKRSIVMPGELPGFGGPQRIKANTEGGGAAGILQHGVQVVPDFTINPSRLPPLGDPTRSLRGLTK